MVTEVSYLEKLQTTCWKEKRALILMRDANKCRNCGSSNNLQVHHRQYHINKITGQKSDPWNYNNKYLITLCNSCHEIGHKLYKVPYFKI
ncbi:MAG: HNH endonuclease [Chitinophagaceae bacterium BSSC1]|nr:MAG: HNH endonuclease [Chitinophagaceae bacterium BSSC1]